MFDRISVQEEVSVEIVCLQPMTCGGSKRQGDKQEGWLRASRALTQLACLLQVSLNVCMG